MVINALAAPAKPTSADTLRRFITTSSSYLSLRRPARLSSPIASEFVDPWRFRRDLQDCVERLYD